MSDGIWDDDDQIFVDDHQLWLEEVERENKKRQEFERLLHEHDEEYSGCSEERSAGLSEFSDRSDSKAAVGSMKTTSASKPAEKAAHGITYSDYCRSRSDYHKRNIWLALTIGSLCGYIALALTKTENGFLKGLGILLFAFFIIGIWIYRHVFLGCKLGFETTRIFFEREASKEEKALKAEDDMRRSAAARRRARIALIIIAAAIVAAAAVGIAVDVAKDKYSSQQQALMANAQELINKGLYDEAREYLNAECDPDFPGVKELAVVCCVHSCYAKGDLAGAYSWTTDRVLLGNLDRLPQSEKEFCEKVKKEYYNSRSSAYSTEKSHSMPYIGMWEGYVNKTQLGEAGRVETRRHTYSGITQVEKIYKFYKDKKIIYVVTCVNGYVTEITDKRGSSSGSSSGSSGSSSGSSGSLVPSPDTKYFSDPEDFYDYYYDDFLDYEEAEEYYYSHGGR